MDEILALHHVTNIQKLIQGTVCTLICIKSLKCGLRFILQLMELDLAMGQLLRSLLGTVGDIFYGIAPCETLEEAALQRDRK